MELSNVLKTNVEVFELPKYSLGLKAKGIEGSATTKSVTTHGLGIGRLQKETRG